MAFGTNPQQHINKYTHTCEKRLQVTAKIAAGTLWIIRVRCEGLAVAAGEVKGWIYWLLTGKTDPPLAGP